MDKDEDKIKAEITQALLSAAESGTLFSQAEKNGMPKELLDSLLEHIKDGKVELAPAEVLEENEDLAVELLDLLHPDWSEQMEAGQFWASDTSTIDEGLSKDEQLRKEELDRISATFGVPISATDTLAEVILRRLEKDAGETRE